MKKENPFSERVARGGKLLDELAERGVVPLDWRQRINIVTLNLVTYPTDIVKQVTGKDRLHGGLEALGITKCDVSRLGFDAEDGATFSDHELLKQAWLQEIYKLDPYLAIARVA